MGVQFINNELSYRALSKHFSFQKTSKNFGQDFVFVVLLLRSFSKFLEKLLPGTSSARE